MCLISIDTFLLRDRAAFEKTTGLFGRLAPADQLVGGLAGELIEGQVQIKKRSFFMGLKIPDVTAPALISSGNRLALWRQASRATGSTHVHK